MTGLEMLTATREGLPVAFFILRDRELSQIAQFQRRVLNRTTLTELHSMDFKAYSQSLGLEYFHIDQDAQIQEILGDVRTHLGNKVPTLTEVNIDYSRETFFTQGALKTNFDRLDIKSKIRMAGRLVGRKIFSRD